MAWCPSSCLGMFLTVWRRNFQTDKMKYKFYNLSRFTSQWHRPNFQILGIFFAKFYFLTWQFSLSSIIINCFIFDWSQHISSWLACKLSWCESYLWHIITSKANTLGPLNAEQLRSEIQHIWYNIKSYACHNLVWALQMLFRFSRILYKIKLIIIFINTS